jgi:hypothetical protein
VYGCELALAAKDTHVNKLTGAIPEPDLAHKYAPVIWYVADRAYIKTLGCAVQKGTLQAQVFGCPLLFFALLDSDADSYAEDLIHSSR